MPGDRAGSGVFIVTQCEEVKRCSYRGILIMLFLNKYARIGLHVRMSGIKHLDPIPDDQILTQFEFPPAKHLLTISRLGSHEALQCGHQAACLVSSDHKSQVRAWAGNRKH